ncbi:hypothetical protein GCM10009533_40330 [Saccharopolyspora spinosporotrichia]|uniref:Uncharacterized protein n=1 Tax=Saccharopolyspora erythraea TaxID=1836 RepID=A0ABP3N6H0_SACER
MRDVVAPCAGTRTRSARQVPAFAFGVCCDVRASGTWRTPPVRVVIGGLDGRPAARIRRIRLLPTAKPPERVRRCPGWGSAPPNSGATHGGQASKIPRFTPLTNSCHRRDATVK